MVGVRIDIDTARDAKTLPATLELLDKYNVKASFFVTTGVDETYRNYRHYLNPFRLISSRALRRYGTDMFSGLVRKRMVQDFKGLETILEQGHELGLHGYNHYTWMTSFESRSTEEISDWISRGCELFEEAFGFYPRCFASPGFRTSENFLHALDEFGFNYSSDFMGMAPFYPSVNGLSFKTRQLPVTWELGYLFSSEGMKQFEKRQPDGYSLLYFHPSAEPVLQRKETGKIMAMIRGNTVPLAEQIEYEDTADI